MASKPFIRIVGAITALWVTIALVEPPGVMICPVHDAPLSVVSPDAHGGHHAMPDDSGNGPTSECCACLGDCASTSAPIALPTAAIVASIVDVPTSDVPALPEFAPITRGDVVIPFANGPPSLT
ncbi:MAG TPA: hypothetical protein VJR92_11700 [Gemmatimonadaceae bacterium]|nr:hypothetical protein [Gemmatimonadaceae bacterium]